MSDIWLFQFYYLLLINNRHHLINSLDLLIIILIFNIEITLDNTNILIPHTLHMSYQIIIIFINHI